MQAGRQEQAVMSVRRKVTSGVTDGKAGSAAANMGPRAVNQLQSNGGSLGLTSYVTPLSMPASQGIRSCTTFWTQPHSLVHKSSAVRPTFQSGLGPNMARKDMMWRLRSTENSAEGAARLGTRMRMRSMVFYYSLLSTLLLDLYSH